MEVWSGPQLRRRSSDGYRCNKCAGRHRSTDRELCCLGKDSLAGLAQEVGNAHDAAVVHAFAFCQLEAQPLSLGELHLADVFHGGLVALPCDLLAERSGAIGSFLLGWQILDLLSCICRRHRDRRRNLRGRSAWSCAARELGGLGEDARASWAFEVVHTHDLAVVHATAVRQLQADPLAFGELHFTLPFLPFHVVGCPSEIEPSAVFALEGSVAGPSSTDPLDAAPPLDAAMAGGRGAALPASCAAWAKTPLPAGHSK
mmetsp:Transcript_175697/g.563453  ORF Transcript_175697/g.563453 Transcript_175697/m.563453 type:complete len:258 (-) Transcript_175697:5-778(-)